MSLDIAIDAELRGVSDLRQLVGAVLAATADDETDWLEWKSTLDLTTKEGGFAIARAVLGLSNRVPHVARRACGGLGYVLVGVEPGKLSGVTAQDPAKLVQMIEPYVGSRLRWTPTYVDLNEKTVLVVSVEPPRDGDPMHVLRKEYSGSLAGAVYVRRPGKTVPATPADIEALERRLLARSPGAGIDLVVTPVGDVPLSWIDPTTTEQAITAWAKSRFDSQIRLAEDFERRKQGKSPSSGFDLGLGGTSTAHAIQAFAEQAERNAQVMRSAGLLSGGAKDERTLDQFKAEVEAWRQRFIEKALDSVTGACCQAGLGVLAFTVKNRSEFFLSDVELVIKFPGDFAQGFDDLLSCPELPSQPRPYGQERPLLDLNLGQIYRPAVDLSSYSFGGERRRTWVEDGSIVVTFAVGDLRPLAEDESDDIYVFMHKRPPDGSLVGSWSATVRGVDAVISGDISVEIAQDPIDVVDAFVECGE